MDLPARIRLADHIGTIRFVGQVDGTAGVWLGVEWDDPERGRHDGVKDNKRYFTCRLVLVGIVPLLRNPTAGSFIRPSAKISYGKSFLQALASKYVETLHGHESPETIVLGSSQGAIVVEAVNLDKIRGKLGNLARLREVSLDDEDVAKCDPVGSIQQTCPKIQGLDLSMSLIPSWDVLALITRELPALQRLALNRTRLQPPTDLASLETAFLRLTELLLNGTKMTWPEAQAVMAFMPSLRVVEMGHNSLTHLRSPGAIHPSDNDTIEVINLDSNSCLDWIDIWNSLKQYTSLHRLILTSNCVEAIPSPESSYQRLHSVRHMSLSHNKINDWKSIDALSAWCPALETLTSIGNLFTDHEPPHHTRPFIISRIPSLMTLDGAMISPRERVDSEMFYQSFVMQHGPTSEEERRQAHPQWVNLCLKHGMPEGNIKRNTTDKLSHRLIALKFHNSAAEEAQAPSVPLVLKALGCGKKATVRLWLRHSRSDLREVGLEHDQQDLDWLGIMDGSDLSFCITEP